MRGCLVIPLGPMGGTAMNILLRLIVSFWLISSGFLFSAPAYAECGGQQQCIAVSINPLVAPSHGSPLTSAPIAFGSQAVGTTSTARAILVAAVFGPASTKEIGRAHV